MGIKALSRKKLLKSFGSSKKSSTFAPAIEKQTSVTKTSGNSSVGRA
jgi:hypothetical protein